MALLLGVRVLVDKSYNDLDMALVAEADVLFLATGRVRVRVRVTMSRSV